MSFAYSPFVWPLALACLISAALAAFTLRRRHIPGAYGFIVLLLGIILWSGGAAASVSATSMAGKLFWYKAQYFGIVLLPGTWLLFALRYTDRRRWLGARYRLLLCIEPLLILAVVWTNELHGLEWPQVGPTDPHGFLRIGFGPFYWLGTVYSFAIVSLGTVVLSTTLGRSRQLFLRQASALLVASLLPLVANSAYLFRVTDGLDLTPFSFSISGAAFFWGFLRYGFLDVVPIARGAVVDLMTDGLIVIDRFGRVVDVNPTAGELLQTDAAALVGRSLDALPPALAGVLPGLGTEDAAPEVTVDHRGARRWLDLRLSPMRRDDEVVGSLLVIRDATDRVLAQHTLRASEERLRLALAAARMATWDWDLAAGQVVWSGETLALFGRPASRLDGHPRECLALLHPDDRRHLQRAMLRALRSQTGLELELRFQQPDGTSRWLDCRGQVVGRGREGRRVIGTVMDVTERRAATEALAHHALHDVLTGLANRRLVGQRLADALQVARARGGEVGLLVIDLDRFKEVNDSLGHHAGDALLCGVGQRIQSVLEPSATLGRLGGDEFGIVIPSTSEHRLLACAERVLAVLEPPFDLDGHWQTIGASIGVARYPAHGDDAAALLRRADAFMYTAKRTGGGLSTAAPALDKLAA